MKSLIHSLQHFSKASTEHVALFSKLTLKDFGFYVSDEDAVKYVQDNSFPLGERAFALKNGLYQCRYDRAASQFVPHPWKAASSDPLGCSTLFQNDEVTLCWFVIPPGRVLPLHDHPGMTVWQRIMHGRLHLCTFACDRPPTNPDDATEPLEATVVFEGEVEGKEGSVSASDIFSFGSSDGPILHEIRNVDASKPALFVDIIAPPYNQSPTNISCGYYRAEPLSTTDNNSSHKLEGLPSDCGVHWGLKSGARVRLHPRPEYVGPAMNAYVNVGGD